MGNKIPALQKYHFAVVDENDNLITSGLRVSIFIASSTTATVYADAFGTALTNPITSTVFGTALGEIEFWYSGPLCDVVINDGIGRLVKIEGLTPSQNRIVFDSRKAVGGVMGNVTGTDLVDVAGTFVDYAETVTIDGTLLRAGDVIKVSGLIVADNFHTQEEIDIKIEAIDGTNDPLLLHTGDVVIAADDDYIKFEIDIRVHTAGVAAGKIIWDARCWTNLNATLALLNCTVEDGVSLAGSTLDLTDDIVFTASADYKNAHADQESQVLWSVQVIKGVIAD